MHDQPLFLRDLALVLAVASTIILFFHKLKLPAVVGYLVAGLLIGHGVSSEPIVDRTRIQALAELGVVLLLFSIGLEFGLRKLVRQGPRIIVATVIETTLLFFSGIIITSFLGWELRDRIFAGAAIAVASTMILSRTLADHPPERRLRDLVLGINIVEDLVAILLIAALGALVTNQELTPSVLLETGFRLGVFFVSAVAGGLLIVPRAIRFVMRIGKMELTLVTAVGICFLLAWLAGLAGHSTALGAFIAGFLVNESGAGREVREIVRPLRYLFGALFFVSIGMLAEPRAILDAWPAVLLLASVVVLGSLGYVAVGAFLAGFGVNTSVRAGFYMAQIGEFAFIIAAMAATAGITGLYPVVVGVSIVTATLSSLLVRRADRVALWFDRKLPHPLQTYASLYSSWIEILSRPRKADPTATASLRKTVFRSLGLLAIDSLGLAAVVFTTAWIDTVVGSRLENFLAMRLNLPPALARYSILGIGAIIATPLLIGLLRTGKRLAKTLSEAVLPPSLPGRVDNALSPRRVFTNTLMLVILSGALIPMIIVTLPVLPSYGGPGVLAIVLIILGVSIWRSVEDLAGHATAGAELIVHVLARQGTAEEGELLDKVRQLLPGLGALAAVRLASTSPAVGRTLGDLNLRGRTGATVVAIVRGTERIVTPSAAERLENGDLLAITGSRDSILWARGLLERLPAH